VANAAQGHRLYHLGAQPVKRSSLGRVNEAQPWTFYEALFGQVGSKAIGADANFYTHELLEAEHMAAGMSDVAAHAAALEQAGVSPYSLAHPDLIEAMPEWFSSNWRAYWGLE
jgi:hypothetical protein